MAIPGNPKPRTSTGAVKKRRAKRPATARTRVLKVVKWLLVLGLVGTLIVVGGFVYLYNTIGIPDPNKDFLAQASTVYYADGKAEVGTFAKQDRHSLAYADMPENIKEAVVAAEDRTFWTNSGIDPKGILRAFFSNAEGNSTQGASTITQQYVKILYLSQERTFTRKIKEAIIALKLQKQQHKQQILEGYLNTIYFGRGAYGIEAASEAYFSEHAKQLTLRQAAVLAALINNPNGLDPTNGKDARVALKGRFDYVLSSMASMGDITATQATQAQKKLPKFPKEQVQSQYGGQRGFMLTMVRSELHNLGFSDEEIDSEGLKITTTFDPKFMKAAEDGVLSQRPAGFKDKELHVAVATVQPGTGALLGFYAGQDFLQSQINWAVAGGMAGSTMKPFTLATALENGFSLKSRFQGTSPFRFPDGLEVKNEGEGTGAQFGTSIDATFALEQSVNTAFVDMSNSIPDGPAKIYANMLKMGLTPGDKPDKRYPGIGPTTTDLSPHDTLITLGKARVSPINMANAYATLANQGVRANVHVITKVEKADGTEVYHAPTKTVQAVPADVSADTTYAMQQVVKSGTGQNALVLGRPVAGKTGTATAQGTNGQPDHVSSAWFVGMTPQLSTAVMYVRGKGSGQLDGWLPSYFGADYPTRTWAAVMGADLAGQPIVDFPPPANIVATVTSGNHAPYTPPPPPPPKPTTKPKPSPKPTPTTSAPPPPTTSAPPPPPTTSAPPPPPTILPSSPPPSSGPPSSSGSPGGGASGGPGPPSPGTGG